MFTRKSLFPSFLQSYGEEVKAKNEKQRTRALRGRVGDRSGKPVHFCPVFDASLQMSNEPYS